MTLILEIPTEKEETFKSAARRQGISVEEFLIVAGERALAQTADEETARLEAIQKLKGFGRGSRFSSEAIRRDRNEDRVRDEHSFGAAEG